MQIASKTMFVRHHTRGMLQMEWTTSIADLETPVSTFRNLGGGKAMSLLLESLDGASKACAYCCVYRKLDSA